MITSNDIYAEKKYLFDDIYNQVCKAWKISKINTIKFPVPKFIQEFLLLRNNITIVGNTYKKEYKDFDLYIIKETSPENEFSFLRGYFCDEILNDNRISIVVIINEDIIINPDNIDYDKTCWKISNIYHIFNFIINSIEKFYPLIRSSTLYKIFKYAPTIMAFRLGVENYNNEKLGYDVYAKLLDVYQDLVNKDHAHLIEKEYFKSFYSYSVKELLDYMGVISILENKEEQFKDYLRNFKEDDII